MRPFFLKKKSLWYSVFIIGVAFVCIGLFQLTVSVTNHSSGGGPLTPASGAKTPVKGSSATVNIKAGEKKSKDARVSEAGPNAFFVEYRLERDRTRSQQIDWLREIVNNQNSSEEAKKEAQRRMLALSQAIETEMKLENLLRAENFKDAVVIIEAKSITVIVQVPMLTALDRQKIASMSARVAGVGEQSVVIIPKN